MTLREKLKAMTAPCREADAEIAATFDPELCFIFDDEDEPNLAPHYTASLDATVELVEREMPLGDWRIRRAVGDYTSLIVDRGAQWRTRHALPAVALLLTLLEAKEME